jgi:hypothetical protein
VEKFQVAQWRRCVTLPSDFVPPPDVRIALFLDSSPTTGPQSDKSAFACGFVSQRESDGVNELTVLDMATDKYVSLASATLDLIQKWEPLKFSYENIPGMDWYRELLLLKAEQRGVAIPQIEAITPRNTKCAKENRIWRLQSLFGPPPAIVFRWGSYCELLFKQVEEFQIGGDRKGRENGLLDSLAYLAFH